MAKNAIRLMLFRSPASSLRWLCTATATATETATEAKTTEIRGDKKWRNARFHQLSSLIPKGTDANVVAPTLDEWVKQGKTIKKFDIVNLVHHFRNSKRYHHAIQLLDWTDKNLDKLSNADCARYIDLLAKTNGLESAKRYFDSLEGSAKTEKTYGALLNCYCGEKALDKASELFEKIKELNFVSSLSYHNMMSLYLSIGQPETTHLLAEEMEEHNIPVDMFSYNILMDSYVSLKDFDSFEGVIEKMKMKNVEFDWFTYGHMASIYINAGHLDKANAVLEQMENLSNLNDREAFHSLITLYGRSGNVLGLHRVWKSMKSTFRKLSNVSYIVMLITLSKLEEWESLEKCFRDWELDRSSYDVRVSNVMLESFLKRDMVKDAEFLYENMLKGGNEPNLKTLDLLANFYVKNRQINLAMKYLEMGASKAKPVRHDWFPKDETIKLFLKYFEEENDSDLAEKFRMIMKQTDRLDKSLYDDSILCTNMVDAEVQPESTVTSR